MAWVALTVLLLIGFFVAFTPPSGRWSALSEHGYLLPFGTTTMHYRATFYQPGRFGCGAESWRHGFPFNYDRFSVAACTESASDIAVYLDGLVFLVIAGLGAAGIIRLTSVAMRHRHA